jgi:hypothetical protein
MIRFLRKKQPRNPALAVLYWVLLVAVALAVLFALFYLLDDYLPGQGMF